ncbi:MAG TPA: YbfB/YjiJ family MFS transporter, partial [Rhodocyclaceae bacterium]|nr:YbfB/YjiJ family MFS transporter [Rhodocyclaceae bacterium]
ARARCRRRPDPGAACKAGDAAVSAPGGSAGRPAETPAGPAARRDQHRLVLCYGLFGFGYILPATFLPAQARALVADPAVFGWVWPVFGLAALVSTVVAARLASTWPRRGLWACAQLVMAGGVLLPALWPQLVALVVAALCVGGTFVVITMIGLQEARVVAGARAQALMAAMTAAFAAGQLAGPLLVGVMDSFAVPYEIALWLAAGGLAASAALLGRHSSRTFRSQQELT